MANVNVRHWALRTGAAVVAVAVSTFGVGPASTEAKAAMEACTIQCASGGATGCQSGYHKTWEDPQEQDAAGEAHPLRCDPLTCSQDQSHACEVAGDLQVAAQAVEAADVTTLASLLESQGGYLLLNQPRSAVQVYNCAGSVVGHFPVDATTAALLEPEAR